MRFCPLYTHYTTLYTHTHAGNVKSAQRQQATQMYSSREQQCKQRKKERAKTRVSFYYFSYIASSSTLTWSETVSCVRAVGCCGTLLVIHNFCQLFCPIFFTSVCCACVLFRECRANSRKNILIFDTKTSSFFFELQNLFVCE